MQWQPCMAGPIGRAALSELSSKMVVGIWGYHSDPDNLENMEALLETGVTFVNTDLPYGFVA